MAKKIVLIDGNSVAYRAFFALPLLNNDKGIHTNAIYGFAMMLDKILQGQLQATFLINQFRKGYRHRYH